jgi:C1A family cysteine protease
MGKPVMDDRRHAGIADQDLRKFLAAGSPAVLATGYDQSKRTFRIRNSWGPTANNGYFEMDYDYVLNSAWAANFWVVYQTVGFRD